MAETGQVCRCNWSKEGLMQAYHDHEWGVPLHDEQRLFELLVLEAKHCGLSWMLVLNKRETLRQVFDGFDPHKLAQWAPQQLEALYDDPRVIRNRKKIHMVVENAKAYWKLVERHGSLDAFLWRYVDGVPIVGNWSTQEEIPAKTPLSDRLSKDLKQLGFQFLGSVTTYAYMQAMGMVNDHITPCAFRRI